MIIENYIPMKLKVVEHVLHIQCFTPNAVESVFLGLMFFLYNFSTKYFLDLIVINNN